MLVTSCRLAIARHVLGLTLQRQVAYSTAAHAVVEDTHGHHHGYEHEHDSHVPVLGSRKFVQEHPLQHDKPPKPRTPRVPRPWRPDNSQHALAHPTQFHLLLACVYVLPPEIYRIRSRPPPHFPKSSKPPYNTPILAVGPLPPDVIAVFPPDMHPRDQMQCALYHSREVVTYAVPYLLQQYRPESMRAWHVHLELLYRFIVYLSPQRKWNDLSPPQHSALLHLWKEYLAGLEILNDLGALPRQYGAEGTRIKPERFTPLFYLLLSTPGGREQPRDWRMRVWPPNDPPTISGTLEVMQRLGLEPSVKQLSLLAQNLTLQEISNSPRDSALGAATARIAADLIQPNSYESFTQRNRVESFDRHLGTYYRDLQFSVGERAISQLEASATYEQEPSAAWRAVVDRHRPIWRDVTARLAKERSDGRAGPAPTKGQAWGAWLLLRDVLISSPQNELRVQPDVVGDYDLGDPFDLLALLLGTGPPLSQTANPRVLTRASTAVVRIARAAARRRLFSPVLTLVEVVGDRKLPVRARTAVYIAGAARHPEDLVKLLPLLYQLDVEAPGEYSAHVVQSLVSLARQADDLGVGESSVELLYRVLAKWGLHGAECAT